VCAVVTTELRILRLRRWVAQHAHRGPTVVDAVAIAQDRRTEKAFRRRWCARAIRGDRNPSTRRFAAEFQYPAI
jgi:hypothetical protein